MRFIIIFFFFANLYSLDSDIWNVITTENITVENFGQFEISTYSSKDCPGTVVALSRNGKVTDIISQVGVQPIFEQYFVSIDERGFTVYLLWLIQGSGGHRTMTAYRSTNSGFSLCDWSDFVNRLGNNDSPMLWRKLNEQPFIK